MSVVKCALSRGQEKRLTSLLGHARLHLLFKASVHGYEPQNFHARCDRQGPTLLVAYNQAGFLFGAYTSKDYSASGEAVSDNKAFLYSLGAPGAGKTALRVVSDDGQCGFTDGAAGPDFGALQFLHEGGAAVVSNPGTGFTFKPEDMHGDDLKLTEFEVYRVEDLGGLLAKPWRATTFTADRKKALMEEIKSYRPELGSVPAARGLLVGPVGAGKSSFFNSINSVFRGHMTSQAISGVCGRSVTMQFRSFSIKAGKGGTPLPLVLCDTMGLESQAEAGLDVEDLYNIYKGHITDRYQFSPGTPLQEDSPGFRKKAPLKDHIHCVVYLFDTSILLSDEIIDKMAVIRKKTNLMGIPQLLLMTKVEEACPLVKENLSNVYLSEYIHRKAQQFSKALGIPLSCVIPVKNYSQELDLDVTTDVLLLSAVQQMLFYADSFLENQVVDDSEQQSEMYRSTDGLRPEF